VYINLAPITDIRDPDTLLRQRGRERSLIPDFSLWSNRTKRKCGASALVRGRDIYAITAPIVVEAAHRVVNGLSKRTGVVAAGEVFAAQDFLMSLSPSHLSFEMQ